MARDLTRSPFPGMDPYLEQYWGDVHAALCTYSRDALRKSLPPGLIARLEERTIIQDDIRKDRNIIPDVRVVDYGGKRGVVAAAPTAPDKPIILENLDEPVTEGLVQVLDTRQENRIITVIEFASPANKVSATGRQMYLMKQQELLYGGVNLVEVDLIRSGRRNLRAPLAMLEHEQRGTFYISVTRGKRTSRSEVYPIKLPSRLPVIGIPLRETDADVVLDLQMVFDQVYENGSYGYDVDYSRPPVPALNEADNAWATELLAAKL